MQKLVIDSETLATVTRLFESGLDYYTVNAKCSLPSVDQPFFVRSNGVILPFNGGGDFYDVEMLAKLETFPDSNRNVTLSQISSCQTLNALIVNLPPGYIPAHGGHALLGKLTLPHPARFFRFTSTPTDPRYTSGQLSRGTYLSTQNDATFVNTGFGAVGRFALPMPIPASYRHDYTFPVGTVLSVGTVSPAFGQSGGGVEVCTTTSVSAVLNTTIRNDDC
jgi:hypothetical protein